MSRANDTLHEPLLVPAVSEAGLPDNRGTFHSRNLRGAAARQEGMLQPPQQEEEGNKEELRQDNDSLQEPLLLHDTNNERLVDGMPWSTSLLIKTLYFLEALCAASWGRFAAIYYNLHGLNRAQVGVLEGTMPCIRTVFKPMWGILSDKFNCRKLIYLLTKIVSTLLLLLLSLSVVYTSYTNIICVSLGVMVFSANGILDAYTLELLGTKHKLRYGRYRMYACLSWGMGAIVMGYVTDHYGFGPNFYIYGILGGISTLLVAWRIPNVKQQPLQESGSIMQLLLLATRPRVTFFLLEVIIVGIGMGTVERLLFLYMVDDLQASTLLCGTSVGVNVVLELPIFWNAKRLVGRFGHDGMMMISMTCFCIRVFGYTVLTPSTRGWILVLEVLHGITFACFYITATDIAKGLIVKCPGWNTTIPVLVQTLYDALGAGIGSIVGGWVMQHYGSRFMYRGMATIMTVLLVLHIVGSMISRHCCGKELLPDYGNENDVNENVTTGSQETTSLDVGEPLGEEDSTVNAEDALSSREL